MKIIYILISYCYLWLPKKIQKSLQKTLFQQQESEKVFKIELSNGEVQKLVNFENHSNHINLISLRLIIMKFVDKILRTENLIILTLLIIALSGKTYNTDFSGAIIVYYTLTTYLVDKVQFLINLFIVSYQRYKQQSIINNYKCRVFQKFPDITDEEINRMEQNNQDSIEFKAYQTIKWSQLQVGEIVSLKNGKQSPADLLILDSSQEQVLVDFDLRIPCTCTFVSVNQNSKGNMMDFITKLSGSISFTIQENITGSIKLKNDPKATPFTKKNMIMRGEILDRADWVFGLAIRVGNDCCDFNKENFTTQSWLKDFLTHLVCFCALIFLICFVPKIIYLSLKEDDFFFNSVIYCLLLLPQNLLVVEKIWYAFMILTNIKLFENHLSKFLQKRKEHKKHLVQIDNSINILSQNERKILMPVKNQPTQNPIITHVPYVLRPIKLKQNKPEIKGFLTLAPQNILDLIKTDVVVIENPHLLFKAQPKVVQIVQNFKTYQFNYDKLKDLVNKASPQQKTNCDKLLIDTNRQQTQDEMKTQDIELLISEKRVPELRTSVESIVQAKQLKKLQFSRNDSQIGQKNSEPKLGSAMSKKKSARYIFDQSFAKPQQQQQQQQQYQQTNGQDSSKDLNANISNSFQSSHVALAKAKSQFGRPGTIIKNSSSSFNNSQKHQNDPNSDRLIGDVQSEQDFLEVLYSRDDTAHNEILVMMLVTNSILSVYNEKIKKLEFIYENKFDESIIKFAGLFDYNLVCSTELENSRPEFYMKTIIKKVVTIGNSSKIFDILAYLEPTENRKNCLSVLVRDPESFLLDEGALLYTRIETNNSSDHKSKYNEQMQEMTWDGQKTFLYTKKQLGYAQTDEFLKKLSAIYETYANRSHEIEKLFIELEAQSESVFTVGIKSHNTNSILLSSQEITQDCLNPERIFQTIQSHNLKTCLITNQSYDDLIIFLRSHQIVFSKDQLIEFKEKDTQQLQFKFRQQLTFMMEQCDEAQIQERFIIVNSDAFNTIIKDDFLKYHFVFILQFSSGLGAYQFTSKQRGQLVKILKLADKKILCIGNSLDNGYLFSKSDMSISVMKNDSLIATTYPRFVTSSLKQIFKMLFVHCPNQMLKYIAILEFQLYRAILIGLIIYASYFENSFIDFFYLLIFYLAPSNIMASIQYYYLFYNNIEIGMQAFQNNARLLLILKKKTLIKNVLNTFLISLVDFGIFILIEKTLVNFIYQDGKTDSTSFIILNYIALELLDKSKIIYYLIKSEKYSIFKYKQILIAMFSFSILIIVFIIVQTVADDHIIIEGFNSNMLIAFIFLAIFALGLSYNLREVLETFNIEFILPFDLSLLDQNQQEINKIKKQLFSNDSFSQDEEEKLQMFTKRVKEVTDQLFDNKDLIDESIMKLLKGDQILADEMDKIHGFQDKRTEKDFQDFFKQQMWYKYNLLHALIFYELCILVMHFYDIFTQSKLQLSVLITVIIQFVMQLFITFLQMRVINDKKIKSYLQLISFCLRFIFKIIVDFLYIGDGQRFLGFLFNILFLLTFSLTNQPRIPILLYGSLQLIIYLVDLFLDGFTMNFTDYKILIFCIAKFTLILVEISYPLFQMVQKIQFLQRSSYIYQNRLNSEQKKINNILGLLMPRFIQERMNKGQIQISEDQGDVTVLFCDIYQFDKVIKFQQENILDFLDTLYRAFDQLCQTYDLQKIETVGKTYMAAGGLKDYDAVINQKNSNSTARALDTAIAMMETVKTMKYGDNQDVKLKIGVHYGRVIAGVIGVHKPQFSLIGDTVNTTSRVCSTGDAGFITLSESAYNHIKDTTKHQFEQKAVAAKGKGTLQTFRLKTIHKEKESSRVITPKVGLEKAEKEKEEKEKVQVQQKQIEKETQQKQEQNDSKELKVMIMPLSDGKKPMLKSVMKRASVMNPIGLGSDSKSPKVFFRKLHMDLARQPVNAIITKKSLESEQKVIEIKRLNSQKSRSESMLEPDQPNLKAKTPALINTMRSSIVTQQRKVRQSEDGALQHGVSTLQQFSMSQFQPNTDGKIPLSSSQNSQTNQQPIVNSFNQTSQNQLVLIAEHPSKESINQDKSGEDAQISQQKVHAQIIRPLLKKKGTLIMVDLAPPKKVGLMKSSTKIIMPEDREKVYKLGQIGQIEDEQIIEQKGGRLLNKQKSIKPIQQDSESALKKEVEVEKYDELEINKRMSVAKIQKKLDLQKLINIKKFKLDFDRDYNYEGDQSQYNSQDQLLYYQIYEEFKDQELEDFRRGYFFLLSLLIFKALLYFLLAELSSKQQIGLLIINLCQIFIGLTFVYPIYKFNSQTDARKIKIIGYFYFFCISVLNLLIIYFSDSSLYQVALQTCQIFSIFINLFYQQLLIVTDKQKLIITYAIITVLVSVFDELILEIFLFVISTVGLTYFQQQQVNEVLVKNYRVSQQLSTQIAKYENMLQYLMPPHALKRLLQPDQDSTFIDVLENTTVLFADIAGFTKYSSSVQPETVVEMLRNLFSTFDCFCQMAQVYKVFTIGDCYVCMGVIDCFNRDPPEEAQKVLIFGLKMIQIINDYNKDPQYQHLNMRIGVHTGRVLGGVVGTDVVRYDIYGEDVTIANLMESSGTEGKMLVSEHTKNLVEGTYDDFKFDYAKDVFIPSKQITLPTFFVSLNDLVFSQDE